MRHKDKLEINPNEVTKKMVFKFCLSYIFIIVYNLHIDIKHYIHIVTDYTLKRFSWYRKNRNTYSIKIMTISHGDARNYAYSGWRIYKGGLDNKYKFKNYLDKLQKRYFILEVWSKKEKIDIVKRFKIDSNMLKRHNRTNKIDDLLKW